MANERNLQTYEPVLQTLLFFVRTDGNLIPIVKLHKFKNHRAKVKAVCLSSCLQQRLRRIDFVLVQLPMDKGANCGGEGYETKICGSTCQNGKFT